MACRKALWALACLRSASVVDGAYQIKSKIKSRARRPGSRPEW